MDKKYELTGRSGSWTVVMTANHHIMEHFATKGAAVEAMWEFERGERFVSDKIDVWVIGDCFVTEPGLGGEQWGEVASLDMNQYNVTRRLTMEEVDALMQEFYNEHGNYPDL